MTVVTIDSEDDQDPLPSLSSEAASEIADAAMEQLRAKLGRAPTLAEVQMAMGDIVAEALRRLHAEEAAVISRGASDVGGSHDDDDDSRGARTPTARRNRPR